MSTVLTKDGVDLGAETAALASSLASAPVDSLLGVTAASTAALKKLGIVTVFDLAHALPFSIAAEIVAATFDTNHPLSRAQRVPDGWVVASLRGAAIDKIAASPAEKLASVDGLLTHRELVDALGVASIADLGRWPPFGAARSLAAAALGLAPRPNDRPDPGTPPDLLPANGVYPTEIFYYDRLFLDQFVGTTGGARKNLATAGQLSIADAAAKTTGFHAPALGAMVTMEQSWHVLGLALGQLLHAVALAPGESVRIAMVDWSRRTAGQRDESGQQAEQLTNQTQHNRAISEVAAAVASETQTGGSTTIGQAKTEQGGVSGGVGPIGGTYSQGATSTFGSVWSTSSGSRNVAAQSSQAVAETTQQAAAAVRNRRATVVQEVEESESSTVTTRVVANYNHMHALTVQYYETVQVFSVRTQVARVRRCLFIPIALIDFDELPSGRDAAIVAGVTDDRELKHWLERAAGRISLTYPKTPPGPKDEGDPAPETWDETIETAGRDLVASLPGTRAVAGEVMVAEGAVIAEVAAPSLKAGDQFIAELHDGRRVTATVRAGRARFARGVPVAMLRELKLKSSSTDPMGSVDIAIDDAQGHRALLRNRSGQVAASVAMALITGQEPLSTAERDAALARLKSNRLPYNQAIWAGMDPATLALLLSDYDFEGRPVMEQIDPTPVALAGNYLVFRMNTEPDDAYARATPPTAPATAGQHWHGWLVDHGLDEPHPEAHLVALPSGGVFAEAVLGRANSAELLDVTRFWNWKDSPIPLQPTEILPPSTASRAGTIDLKPGEYAPPMVNIVAPTTLPDPTGMSGVLGAISTANLFRDMSGMDLAAGVARAAMDASTSAAGSAGTISAANFAEMNRHKEAIFDRFLQLYGKGAVGGTAPGNSNISAAGAALNYGRQMDAAGSGGAAGGAGAAGTGGSTNGLTSGTNGTGSSSTNGSDLGSLLGSSGIGGAVTGALGGSNEEAAFGSLIGSGGGGGGSGGGGGGPSGLLGTAAEMWAAMMTTASTKEEAVAALLEKAKVYKLTLSKAGAEAIYEELNPFELTQLKFGSDEAAKLKILKSSTLDAIEDAKGDLKKELQQLVTDVDKLTAPDAGTPK